MIVVDTNVILASLASPRGYSFSLLELLLAGKVEYLMNVTLLSEYRQCLMRPENLLRIPLTLRELEAIMALLVQNGSKQNVYYRWRPNLKDEGDNFLVELAVAGSAESIVTFNKKDFLAAELKFNIHIETPKEYLTRKDLL